MRTGHKGDIAELMALVALVKSEAEIAIPYGNRPGYDLLVLAESGWKKVQVKTAYKRNGRNGNTYVDFLRGSGKGKRRSYQAGDFDVLLAVLQTTGEFWVFPVEDVIGRRCQTVSDKHQGYMDLNWLA